MKKENVVQFTEEQGQALVRLARRTIAKELGLPADCCESDEVLLNETSFNTPRGTFVTLKKTERLRGCIGNISSAQAVTEGVKANAISAAFKDYRFTPLTNEEFPKVEIEISILTEPIPLEYSDPETLPSCLVPHVDGVIIQKGEAGATFLPQVWSQLPKPEDFLSHLCLKAGLSAHEWKKPGLEIFTYRVQHFNEK